MNINKIKSIRKGLICSKIIFPAVGALLLTTQTGCSKYAGSLGMMRSGRNDNENNGRRDPIDDKVPPPRPVQSKPTQGGPVQQIDNNLLALLVEEVKKFNENLSLHGKAIMACAKRIERIEWLLHTIHSSFPSPPSTLSPPSSSSPSSFVTDNDLGNQGFQGTFNGYQTQLNSAQLGSSVLSPSSTSCFPTNNNGSQYPLQRTFSNRSDSSESSNMSSNQSGPGVPPPPPPPPPPSNYFNSNGPIPLCIFKPINIRFRWVILGKNLL